MIRLPSDLYPRELNETASVSFALLSGSMPLVILIITLYSASAPLELRPRTFYDGKAVYIPIAKLILLKSACQTFLVNIKKSFMECINQRTSFHSSLESQMTLTA
ncbi:MULTISPECIES: hypothetical protein [Burkholderia]|uniref:hypothetical protein n=1 Tax=Burkholderia TaxID=32008 RepID=UPI000F778A1C|nr:MULTISPECIES: hypothetical protein [Burkholderia]